MCEFILERRREVAAYVKVLAIGIAILAIELFGAWLSGSLALASDAGHVFTDLMVVGTGIVIAMGELRALTARPRLRLVGVWIHALLLGGVALSIVAEAIYRIEEPTKISPLPLFVAALVGLFGNFLQYSVSRTVKNRTQRGIHVHIASDFACSLAVVISALLIFITGRHEVDTIVSFVIAGAILAFGLPAFVPGEDHRHE
ncbi:MAG: cation transporter [Patescibacteria group bacterium]